jgi:uncharacterized peroxidase-related enzyme
MVSARAQRACDIKTGSKVASHYPITGVRMTFLSSLAEDATLLDVFKKFPGTARPLIEYHQVLMRGPLPLQVSERELIAAYVSGLNACAYCHGVHAATAAQFGVAPDVLIQLLNDPANSPIPERMKALLAFVRKLTFTPNRMTHEDAGAVFAAGWNEQALHDAVSVCALFNFMNRLVEGVGIKSNATYHTVAGERLVASGYAALLKFLHTGPDSF